MNRKIEKYAYYTATREGGEQKVGTDARKREIDKKMVYNKKIACVL
jgi:hypothetical protein